MSNRWNSSVLRYGIAVVAPIAALGLTLLLQPIKVNDPFILFFAAAAASAGFGGLGAGLLTALLSVFLADYFLIEPRFSLTLSAQDFLLSVLLFFVALVVSIIYEARKRAEARTLAEREQFRTTLTSIGDAVITTDMQGRVTLMNPVAEALTGWSNRDAQGRPIAEVFHIVNEQTRLTVENPISRVLKEGSIVGLANHTVLISKDWTEYPIDDSGAPIRDEKGDVRGVVLVFRDITQRHQFEAEREALLVQVQNAAERSAHLQRITGALSGALSLSEVADVFVQQALPGVGATAGSIVKLVDDDTLELVQASNYMPEVVQNWQRFPLSSSTPISEAVRSGTPTWIPSLEAWAAKYLSRNPSGGYSAWAALPLIVKGKTIGGIGFSFAEAHAFSDQDQQFMLALAAQCAQAFDRASLYEAEQQAHREAELAQRRLEFLVKASQHLSSSLDYDLTFNNLRALILPDIADMYTIDVIQPDQTLRRVVTAAIDPHLEALMVEVDVRYPPNLNMLLAQPAFQTGQPMLWASITPEMIVAAARDADHRRLLEQINPTTEILVPMRTRDRPIGVITVLRQGDHPNFNADDVVMVQELANRVAQALDNVRLYDEAKRSVKLRDEFLSVAAHELKTPVTSMRGFAQMLLRQIDKGNTVEPERVARSLRMIDNQSIKLSALITQLLDVSRIESGRLAIEKEDCNLVPLVQNVVGDMQRRTDRHTITLTAPPEVMLNVDPLRFEQVVVNLLDNAIKYSLDGGVINVELARRDPETIQVVVQDHGIGVPPEHRSQLFSRFYQAHGDGNFGGMGLGLYISRQIIELHGGQLMAEFPDDGGTRFVIQLPAQA